MKKTLIKRYIAIFLCIAMTLSSFIQVFAGDIPQVYYDKGCVIDGRVDYKLVHQNILKYNGVVAPTSRFEVQVIRNGVTVSTGLSDSGKILTAYIGDTLLINNTSEFGSGTGWSKCDFQISYGTEIIYSTTDPSSIKLNAIPTNKKGTYNIYLNFMDITDIVLTEGWGNWAYNGSHKAAGVNPGGGTGSDFPGWWYYSKLTVEIVNRPPDADFTISYKESDVTDNKTNPATINPDDKSLFLEDCSVPFSPAEPITSRRWYYWNVEIGWTEIPGSLNKTVVYIDDMDVSLPKTGINKAFRLVCESETGGTDYAEHTAYFKKAPPPPPPPGLADIFVYYRDKNTDVDVVPPDETTYKGVSYGTYTIEAKAVNGFTLDATTPSPQVITVNAENNYREITFYYQPKSIVLNKPPVAIVDAPEQVYAGENFKVSGVNSYDPDGSITEYQWDYDNDITGNTLGNKESGYIWLPYGSSGLVKLQVTDNDGATDSDRKYVDVLPPVPIAKIDVTGILKVNRKVTVSALNSIGQDHYPIDHARDKWTITGDSTNVKYSGTLTGPTKDFLAKAPGDLPIKLQVNNNCIDADHPEGFSDTDSMTIKILPDLKPDADFSVPAVVIRNPADDNNAIITITNTSISPDGDIIGKAVAMYAYDSDNDGNFEEETWYYSIDGINWLPVGMPYADMVSYFNIFNISSSNPSNFILKTNQVGKYRFELRVMEDIPASQTISEFITENDYMRNDTFSSKPIAEKIVEVKNVAPSANFQVKKNIPMDLVVLTDYQGVFYDNLVSNLNTFKTQQVALGIDPNITIISDRKTVGDRTVYQNEWNRLITITVDGWAYNVRGDFPYHNEFVIGLESLKFIEGEENLPDRSKYTYYVRTNKYEDEDNTGDPEWWLGVDFDVYYDGQYQSTYTRNFRLGHGQQYNGLGTWFDYDNWNELQIVVDKTYTNTFKKGSRTVSGYRAFEGLDVDKVMNVNTPSSNRYLLVAADSFWNTIETNKTLKDYISANNISTYLVADNDTLNKVFTLSNFSDIRFINGLKAYEKDGKLYQYSGSILQEIPFTPRVYPTQQTTINIPMHEKTVHTWYSSKKDEYLTEILLDNHYTTTVSIINNSITVNGKVLSNVKSVYEIGDFYFAELFNGDIYYFKRCLNAYAQSGGYLYYKTYISNFVQLSGAKGIKAIKMIPALEYIDNPDVYNPKVYLNAEYFYIQDNSNNVYVAKSCTLHEPSGYQEDLTYNDPTAVSDPTLIQTSAVDFELTKTRVQDHYYDTWGNYRTVDRDVVNVEYALTSELSSVLKVDQDVNIYSAKELIPLKNLYNGIKGGIYAAQNYNAALDDIAEDIKSTTSALTNYYLVNEPINYSTFYSDYEEDAQYANRWLFTQDADYFDNSNGIEPNAGKYITNPINPFTKVGKYEITLQVRDNPKNDDKFDNYRLWSTITDKLTLYVHRKPVALQRIAIADNGNGTFTVKAYDAGSYDPDHNVSREDKGIVAREWRWKEATSIVWTAGQMDKTDCTADKSYITQLRVKDLEGVWSDYSTITIDRNNPPVALFNIEKKIISNTEYLKVKDQSFPQSISSIIQWHWIVNKVNADGSETNIYTKKAAESNTGTGSLAGYDIHVKYSYSSPGKYRVYLRVKDSNGLWSDGGTDSSYNLESFCSKEFEVDKLPEASFVIEKNPIFVEETLKLKDQSTAEGISPITKWHWVVKKLNKDGSVPSNNIQDAEFPDSNTGTGAMAGYDVNVKTHYADKGAGTYRIYLRVMNGNGMWSDGGTESSYNLNNFFHRDLEVQESFKISNFRVVKIRDLHLKNYYYEDGRYEDRPFYVNDMAIDPSNFKVGGISLVPDFSGLTKGYRFEFEIDTTNFNEANDKIVITPTFFPYIRGVPGVRGSEAELYWEDSDKKIYKAGQGAHSRWATITLDSRNRVITGENSATWRGEYFIPATSWLVPLGTSASNAKSSRISADIIVNFSIKGYKNGVMKYNYNLQQWPVERTTEKYPYEIGDVIRYDYTKSSLDDKYTIINRP